MPVDPFPQMRQTAREIFSAALAQSSVKVAFDKHVQASRGVLRVCDDLFDLQSFGRVFAVSIGKAGHTMAEALAAQLGSMVSGIVAAPEAALQGRSQLAGFRYFSGGHPLPNAESIRAADATLKSLASLPEHSLVIFMLSGGGSSIVERPLDSDISLEDLVSTYRALVHSSAPIAEINAIRKHLSAVKGGRMAQAAARVSGGQRHQQVSIMISDVPENSLDALASGPTMPDPTTVEDCYRIAAEREITARLPESVRELFEKRAVEETPKKDDPIFHHARWWPVLSNATAVRAAAAQAAAAGFAVEVDNSCDDQDYTRAADHLLERVRKLRQSVSRVCVISGGEVTVRVADGGGTGGRNQQFALYCAEKIAGENIAVLSAGTDGIDGNSPAAGGVVDGSTLERYLCLGEGSVAERLKRFDAYPALKALGDVIETGPTGTNVRDVRVLLAW